MAVGEHRDRWLEVDDLLYVKVATGIGSGIIAGGHLHRGAQGTAGDLGHAVSHVRHEGAASREHACEHHENRGTDQLDDRRLRARRGYGERPPMTVRGGDLRGIDRVLADDVQLLGKDRVERQLHLIDRDGTGIQLDCSPYCVAPFLFCFTDHAGDQIDVDLRKAQRPRRVVGAPDLGRAMRAAIQFENAVAEILDAKTETRDADLLDRARRDVGDPDAALRAPLDEIERESKEAVRREWSRP